MNQIIKTPIGALGYDFVDPAFLPKGKDEYYLRNKQNPNKGPYRQLTSKEIKQLQAQGNTSDNWKNVQVCGPFDVSLIQQCKFYGLVRIGKLEPLYLEFHDVRLPAGIYNSSIISCDLGDNVVINNVNYLSHYIIGNEVIIVNVNEIEVSDHAKFGNGIIKKGEKESVRIWMELCNENAGRSVLPFDGMQTGDAYLWTRHRDDDVLMQKFKEFTEKKFDDKRGYYGTIGDRTVIKNCRIIKDVLIGSDAYIKGANKLKNLTINSSPDAKSQIGEGCELVNGIIGFGCRIFYGVKAVRFILASHSQLKYGARLINSFLGDNSTISCCEVLNSLLLPAHEQHHNNSFLCAAVLLGQSNVAAGATIGSNHNSRGADGELIAGRGFWPGLCVSLKHNSKFASYTLLAKGDFPAELNIPIPFSMVSNDVANNKLVIMPAYWFMYNWYAIARNEGKYASRDKRKFKHQYFEYAFLAPDTVNEIFDALTLLCKATGETHTALGTKQLSEENLIEKGRKLLEQKKDLTKKEVLVKGFENSTRKVQLIKVTEAYHIFKQLIVYYGITQLIEFIEVNNITSFDKIKKIIKQPKRGNWINVGGQLMPDASVKKLIKDIHSGSINSWDQVHDFYKNCSDIYPTQKLQHAISSLFEVTGLNASSFSYSQFTALLKQAIDTKEWISNGIYQSRAKDYSNPFRKMVYATQKEMDIVIGPLKENTFIKQQQDEMTAFRKKVTAITKQLLS